MSGGLFDKTTNALGRGLDMMLVRNNVTSANIANAETPGYHAKKVDFEEALTRALDTDGLGRASTSHAQHIPVGQGAILNVKPDVYENPDVNISNDGNTVDLEKEMTNLAENSIRYKAAVELINKKLGAMKYVASGGGR